MNPRDTSHQARTSSTSSPNYSEERNLREMGLWGTPLYSITFPQLPFMGSQTVSLGDEVAGANQAAFLVGKYLPWILLGLAIVGIIYFYGKRRR